MGGSWQSQNNVSAKIGGQWKTVKRSFVKINDQWVNAGLGSGPEKPNVVYVSSGVFAVSPYDSNLSYDAEFIPGSGPGGSASFNVSNGRFTVTGETAAFNVFARYFPGGPTSTPAYMERKKYDFTCRRVPQQCCGPCNCRLEGGNCFCEPPGPEGCPPGTSPNGQCGCGGATPCMGGSIGQVVCDTCCSDCSFTACDVLVDETPNGYINGGSEWYKVG